MGLLGVTAGLQAAPPGLQAAPPLSVLRVEREERRCA